MHRCFNIVTGELGAIAMQIRTKCDRNPKRNAEGNRIPGLNGSTISTTLSASFGLDIMKCRFYSLIKVDSLGRIVLN